MINYSKSNFGQGIHVSLAWQTLLLKWLLWLSIKDKLIIFEQTDKAIYRVDNQWSSKKKGIKRKIL